MPDIFTDMELYIWDNTGFYKQLYRAHPNRSLSFVPLQLLIYQLVIHINARA